MTHAIRIHRFGGPEVMQFDTVEIGDPGPGEVRLRHTAAGVNFVDIGQRKGHQQIALPLVLGRGAAGVVEAVGAGVTGFGTGERVAYTPYNGAYAEARLIAADKLVKIPAGLDDIAVGASIMQGLTVQYLVREVRKVGAQDALLVHAAAGGVGLILCQWAAELGATVIGAVSTADKAELARQNGCAHVMVYSQGDFVEQAIRLNGGRKLDAVYDAVGQDTFMRSLDVLRPAGQIISYGSASGPVPPIDVGLLMRKGALGVSTGALLAFTEGRGLLQHMAREWFEVLAAGKVRINVNQTYALKDAAQAHRDLEARRTTGSTALLM
ncbi:MAG: quinone oxidoreductase [Betaproteobacteria bacterium]|nr:quinone oxidoreductase [Betaproteobacteria bacterium]